MHKCFKCVKFKLMIECFMKQKLSRLTQVQKFKFKSCQKLGVFLRNGQNLDKNVFAINILPFLMCENVKLFKEIST